MVQSSEKVIENDKYLKKTGAYSDRNVIVIKIRKSVLDLLFEGSVNHPLEQQLNATSPNVNVWMEFSSTKFYRSSFIDGNITSEKIPEYNGRGFLQRDFPSIDHSAGWRTL